MQQTALSADQLALGQRHLDAVHQAVAAQAASPNATVGDLHRGLGDLVSSGILPSGQAQRYGQQIEALRGNPTPLRTFLNGHLNSLQDARTNFVATYGTLDAQDLGDNMLTRTVSPTMGGRNLGAAPKTLTPRGKRRALGHRPRPTSATLASPPP